MIPCSPNKKIARRLGLAAAFTIAAASAALAQSAVFYAFMEQSCVDPAPDMATRVARLDEWRAADAKEQIFVANFVTDSVARSLQATARLGDTDPANHGAMRLLKAKEKFAAPDDAENPARILLHKTNGFLALYLETQASGGVQAVTCHLLMRGPSAELASDLAGPFQLVPEATGDKLRVRAMQAFGRGPDQRTTYDRALTLHLTDDGKPQIAVLSYETRVFVK